MKKIVYIACLCISSTNLFFAQKAEVKKDVILSDGKPIGKIEKDGCGALSNSCYFYIQNNYGKQLITVTALEMHDPREANVGNPDGKIRYLRYSFIGFDGVAEIRNPALLNTKYKDVIQSVVKQRLIVDGALDAAAVNNFIQAIGERYTERNKELNPKVIIINNNR